ncbi:TetR/AcrR family transcriptional regulator [Jejubacter sp. L23]|uniref:TetR/AcrR family transcriptional regulator n=1 Tax=Jejubacter sp. L23 TaxID=3092086 RepID=UPI003D75A0A4
MSEITRRYHSLCQWGNLLYDLTHGVLQECNMFNLNNSRIKKPLRSRSEMTIEEILNNATWIIHDQGLSACTHRAIADSMDISPGTITYHFKTLDHLHSAVILRSISDFIKNASQWFHNSPPLKKETILTDFIFWLFHQNPSIIKEYEIFLAAISRPRLRTTARQLIMANKAIFEEHLKLTPSSADAVVAFIDSLVLQSIIKGNQSLPDRQWIEATFRSLAKERAEVASDLCPISDGKSLWNNFF